MMDRILLVQLGDIGDVVQTLPCFEALRARFPLADLTVAVRDKATDLLKYCPAVTEVLPVRSSGKKNAETIRYYWSFFQKLRGGRFNVAIDMRTDDRGAMLCALSGAKRRMGFFAADGRRFRNRVFTDLHHPRCYEGIHINQYLFQILSLLGIEGLNPEPRLTIPDADRAAAAAFLRQAGVDTAREIVCLQPFSLRAYKELSTDKYVELIGRIRKRFNPQILVVGGPDERERATRIVAQCGDGVWNLAGGTTLGDFAAVLSLCRLFIGMDSAGQHIAAAVGTPTVTVYGPSQAEAWAPRGGNHHTVQSDLDCVPCRRMGCNDSGTSACLDHLTIDAVMAGIEKGWSGRIPGRVAKDEKGGGHDE